MELRQLRYFLAVAEEGHFGRAAERVRIAQPGLSQQIKALERSLGVVLIDRENRPVRLTAAGERLLPWARTIIEAADRAGDVSREATATDILRVGIPAMGRYPEFSEIISRFREQAPEVELQVVPSTTPAMLDAVMRRSLDVAVVHQPIEIPEHGESPSYVPLGWRELIVALPEDHPLGSLDALPRDALLEEQFLSWPDPLWPRQAAHWRELLFGTKTHPNVIEVFDAFDGTQLELVRRGPALTWFSAPADEPLPAPPQGIVFRRVEDPRPLIEYGMVWADPSVSPATARLVALVTEAAGR